MPPPARRYSAKKSGAGSSQSQAARRSTQGHSQGTQGLTQRARRIPEEDDDDDDDEDEDEEPMEDVGEAAGAGAGEGGVDMDRRVSLLVRLALSVEHSRGSLKRDQINKVVFPNGNTRGFNAVLSDANDELRKVFGFELVELMTRAERDKVGAVDADADDDAGPSRRKNKAGPSSKTYILRSALDSDLIVLANKPDIQLVEAGQADIGRLTTRNKVVNPDEEETISAASRAGGSILGWDVGGEGEGEWYNIMCVILGLVLVNGRSVADHTLKRLLKPLGLTPTTELLLPISTHRRKVKFQDFLTHLTKLGYLERQRAGNAATATQQPKKRGRQSQATMGDDDDDDGSAVECRWGSRAHAEIGERAIADFMVDFMVERAMRDAARALKRGRTQGGDDDEEEDEEAGGRAERAERDKDKAALEERGKKMREAMMRDVERSAGGHLSEAGKALR